MGEYFKWILLGVTIGYALHWLVDRLLWARAQSVPDTRPPEPVASASHEQEPATTPASQPEPTVQDALALDQIPGITPETAQKLADKGILTPHDLAAKSPDELLTALDAQPWDDFDVQSWIDAAKSAAPTTIHQAPSLGQAGLDPDQVAALKSAGIETFAQVAEMDETSLLQAIGAQPWDMVDGKAIIAKAKELS